MLVEPGQEFHDDVGRTLLLLVIACRLVVGVPEEQVVVLVDQAQDLAARSVAIN